MAYIEHSSLVYLTRGKAKFEAGDWKGASEDFDEALLRDRTNVGAWESRALVKGSRRDFKGGVADCTEAIALAPTRASVWCYRGAMRLEMEDYQGAMTDCNEAIRLDPTLANAWNDRGGAKLELGDLEGSLADYDEGVRIDPTNVHALHNRGITKLEMGDIQGAATDFTMALQLKPSFRLAADALNRTKIAQQEKIHWRLEPLPLVAVAPYLEPYGYLAADATKWRHPAGAARFAEKDINVIAYPKLSLWVSGHIEELGHTWYIIECRLVAPVQSQTQDEGASLRWSVRRRLLQLREGLYNHLKEDLGGDVYGSYFGATPFALKGGLPGTTARLRAWFAALARCVNECAVSPTVVAYVLQFLEAAEPHSSVEPAYEEA